MKNMTYAQAIDNAINGNINDEVVERLEALKAQLAKRGSGKHSMTKTQKENEVLKGRILEILAEVDEGLTATEVGEEIGVKCQKASAILKQMVDAGDVARNKVGKVVRFVAVG